MDYQPDYADSILREMERDDWREQQQAAEEHEQQAAATAALDDLRNVAEAIEVLNLDFCDEREIRIDGGRYLIPDALVMACFAKPEQAGVILQDCKAAILRTMIENGVAEVVL